MELDEILLNHRSDALKISHGKSDGLDIGTSAEEAKAKLQRWAYDKAMGAVGEDEDEYSWNGGRTVGTTKSQETITHNKFKTEIRKALKKEFKQ